MSDPLALLPLALAAGGGRIRSSAASSEELEVQQLVAAGFTLLQRSAPLVRALSGRRAAILLPSSPAFFTALAACEGRGAVLLNPLAAPPEIAYQCRDASVGAVFTNSALASRLPEGMATVLLEHAPRLARVIANGTARDVDLGSHHGLSLEGERDLPGRDEELAIVYTSAMRGVALGAVLTHANLLANARSTGEAVVNTAADWVLALLPLSHLFGLTVTAIAPLLAGGRVTTMDRFDAARAVELLAGGVTEIVGVPAVYHALLASIERHGPSLRSNALRVCICGGAPLPLDLQERWADATGVELRQGYGLTEAGPVCLFNRVDRPNSRGTLGVPLPGVEVAIHPPSFGNGADVTPLGDGEPGEICVRGAGVSSGYLHGSAAGLPRRDGWLCTGDRGVRHSDRTVSFLGVLKPMFTRNGYNVYPREIERAVGELRGVTRIEIVAVPDRLRENDIHLRVEGSVSADQVRRWCDGRLGAYEQPSTIEIVG
ncbi:MAG: AMP-binding protein [Gemmatimonadales bacterium]